jgi:hypothetical protein
MTLEELETYMADVDEKARQLLALGWDAQKNSTGKKIMLKNKDTSKTQEIAYSEEKRAIINRWSKLRIELNLLQEKKKAEEEAKKQAEAKENLLKNLPEGITVTDRKVGLAVAPEVQNKDVQTGGTVSVTAILNKHMADAGVGLAPTPPSSQKVTGCAHLRQPDHRHNLEPIRIFTNL